MSLPFLIDSRAAWSGLPPYAGKSHPSQVSDCVDNKASDGLVSGTAAAELLPSQFSS